MTTRRGRPAQVDAAEIADAVLAVGFRDLTFTAVAARLRIGQATLYRHAANRDELVRLGLDLAISRVTWPSLDGPWSQVLREWALAAWHAYAAHPGAAAEMSRGVLPHSVLRLSEGLGAMLIGHGFRPADAVLAVDLVFDLAVDNRRGADDLALIQDDEVMRDRLAAPWPEPADGSPEAAIRAGMLHAFRADPLDWFRGKLRVVLAGVAEELAPGEARS
ncbi:MAG TPA: TetR family transcriptional regulator [Actinoplanes sp.]|nr:TetR family transcriptional regulator [Actinoplanes sp.]